MTEQQMNLENTTTIDLALKPVRLRFTFYVAIVWIIPVIIMLALFEAANIALLPLWSLICISWMFGGNSRMSAVVMEEAREPSVQDGVELVKKRWLALLFGPLIFSVIISLSSLLVFGLIKLVSDWAFLGAILTIPTFILVLISSAIALNIYLMCTIIGYDDIGIIAASKKLVNIAVRKPYYLFSTLSDLINSTFFLGIFSGLIVAMAIYSTMGITGAAIDLQDLIHMGQGRYVQESEFVSGIRVGSVAIIVVLWLSFLVNVAAITSSMAYSGNVDPQ